MPRASATRRGGTLQQSWQVEYQTSFFIYRVELINSPRSSTLIDTDAPFRIVSTTVKGSGGRSMGRTFRFGDYWAVNPAYNGGMDVDVLADLAVERELTEDTHITAGGDDLVRLPSHPPLLCQEPSALTWVVWFMVDHQGSGSVGIHRLRKAYVAPAWSRAMAVPRTSRPRPSCPSDAFASLTHAEGRFTYSLTAVNVLTGT
ncbi:hypothetical protein [Streptomyces sp. NBC_01481]|uniref:hypothetical protein n=1 Tax=Streptomyces sp. NBC_01481 TaxID=2975869 RepID=UPI0022568C13|nr:hypothetical protein [Streptomyces sp. NBC_01481]MCX4585623.1 hypothetical protein [Streptomyces sp. NBC_01481]